MKRYRSLRKRIGELTVRCEHCQQFYKVVLCKTVASQARLLDWVVCEHCNTPRNIEMYKNAGRYRKCRDCKIPYLGILRRGRCQNCYMDWYRKNHKVEVKSVTKTTNRLIYNYA